MAATWVLWGLQAGKDQPIKINVGTLREVRVERVYRERQGPYWADLYILECECPDCLGLVPAWELERAAASRAALQDLETLIALVEEMDA